MALLWESVGMLLRLLGGLLGPRCGGFGIFLWGDTHIKRNKFKTSKSEIHKHTGDVGDVF
jgi:hypothetical protein